MSPSRRRVVITVAATGVVLLVGTSAAVADARHRSDGHRRWSPSASAEAPSAPISSPATATDLPTASADPSTSAGTGSSASVDSVATPPANAGFDYQIGEAYPVPSGIGVVSRDREESPVTGIYSICYVNGFQAQGGELGWWRDQHDDLLLGSDGDYVVDEGWNEVLLDISTETKRQALAALVGAWIDGCADSGYQAVEIDNLDSWTRSDGLLTQSDALAYASLLADRAHDNGLAIAQKNAVELAEQGRDQVGFDFAISESCSEYEISDGVSECQALVEVYQMNVLIIEYEDTYFDQACEQYGGTLSIVERDQDVSAPGSPTYLFRSC